MNHALLFSDLKTDYNVLPEYHHLVIDEAHQIYQFGPIFEVKVH
ncbi:MAG: hypothetical protein WA125_15480 [Desulfosporosinus sp.]